MKFGIWEINNHTHLLNSAEVARARDIQVSNVY